MKEKIFLAVVVSSICYGQNLGECVKYSPYAVSFKNFSGLVPCGTTYSPYAVSFSNSSGLVSCEVLYSPYAFSFNNPSGLVQSNGNLSATQVFIIQQRLTAPASRGIGSAARRVHSCSQKSLMPKKH